MTHHQSLLMDMCWCVIRQKNIYPPKYLTFVTIDYTGKVGFVK